MYSARIHKQGQMISNNSTMKERIYRTFDDACEGHRDSFVKMWQDWMGSMFESPMTLLQGSSTTEIDEALTAVAPDLQATKERVEAERLQRQSVNFSLKKDIDGIPTEDTCSHNAAQKVQEVCERTFGRIRCAVSDQMELYAKSFFLLPMLRRLE